MLSTHLFDPNRSRDDLLLFILKEEFNVEQIEICFDITIYSLLIYTLHCCACIFIQSYQNALLPLIYVTLPLIYVTLPLVCVTLSSFDSHHSSTIFGFLKLTSILLFLCFIALLLLCVTLRQSLISAKWSYLCYIKLYYQMFKRAFNI